MHLLAITLAFLSAALAVQTSPVADSFDQRANPPPPCNADFSQEACGACHYWRECLDSRTYQWITPCEGCDHTSWCNCTAPPGQNGIKMRLV